MGITAIAVHLLREENRRAAFSGAVLQLGEQDIHLSERQLAEQGVVVNQTRSDERITSRQFFGALGFSEVRSLDFSDYQGADILADLNQPVPGSLHGKFDAIIDVGTLEHVFGIPTALKNVHDMLKIGGRYISLLPSSNHVDHGYYSFSPVLFHDYFKVNGYSLDRVCMLTFDGDWFHSEYKIYDYTPSRWLHEFGSAHLFSGNSVATWLVVTKTPDATSNRVPNQSHFEQNWGVEKKRAVETAQPVLGRGLSRVKDAVKATSVGRRLYASPSFERIRERVVRKLMQERFPAPIDVFRS